MIDIAKNAVLDLKTKYHIIEKKLADQRRDISTLIYAHNQALEKNLFEHGVKERGTTRLLNFFDCVTINTGATKTETEAVFQK